MEISLRYKLLKDCEKIMMLAASNLETLGKIPFYVPNQDKSLAKINTELADIDRINERTVVDIYLELFENDPTAFAKNATKAYNFAPLSALMAGQLPSLSNK